MNDVTSIFSLNGTNYNNLESLEKSLFDKTLISLRSDFKKANLTNDNYFKLNRDLFGELSFESNIHNPLRTKIWTTLLKLNHKVF